MKGVCKNWYLMKGLLLFEFLPSGNQVLILISCLVLSLFCHDVFLDDDSSNSGCPSITFSPYSQTGLLQERRPTQEMIPMKPLHRGGKAFNLGQQGNNSQEEHGGRGRRVVLRPKPLFHAVHEEYESEGETEEEASATQSRWSTEHRHGRERYKSHSPLLQRK
jgi:sodium/hydrogen exchanger 4